MTYNTRKSYIDVLKTVAIISVIFCHLQLNDAIGTNVWFIRCDNILIDRLWYILGYIFANLSIPMFMLITGANRFRNTEVTEIDYRKLFKEIMKIIILLIIFQVPFYLYNHMKHGSAFTIIDFAKTIYSSNVEPIYWYFPGFYLAFLLSYPILKKFTLKATKKDYEYLFIVYAIIQLLINNIAKRYNIYSNIPFAIFSYTYMYPLFGDLICNKYDESDFSISKIAILVICAFIYFITSERYDAMNIYVAMIVLVLMRYTSSKNLDFSKLRGSKFYKVIDFSAKNALVFYLLHPYILRIIYKISNKIYTRSIMYVDYIVGIIFLFINFIVTYIVIFALKKILLFNGTSKKEHFWKVSR